MKISPHHSDLLRFEAAHVWIDHNREMLLAKYPDQWIAVRGSQLLAGDPDFDNLLAKLPDPSRTAVEFVTQEPIETVV